MKLNIVGNYISLPPLWGTREQVLFEVGAKQLPTVLINFNSTLKIFLLMLNIVGNYISLPPLWETKEQVLFEV